MLVALIYLKPDDPVPGNRGQNRTAAMWAQCNNVNSSSRPDATWHLLFITRAMSSQ